MHVLHGCIVLCLQGDTAVMKACMKALIQSMTPATCLYLFTAYLESFEIAFPVSNILKLFVHQVCHVISARGKPTCPLAGLCLQHSTCWGTLACLQQSREFLLR